MSPALLPTILDSADEFPMNSWPTSENLTSETVRKGFEQHSEREFGWFREDEMSRNALSLVARKAALQACPRLFGQFL
jgi:hypothetical protein